jgi:hypothetical protein
VLTIRVETDDLFRTRFALSPLSELGSLLRVLAGGTRHTAPPAWVARMTQVYRELYRDTDLPAVVALQGVGFGADFTALPPRSLAQTWEDDLRAVRAVPPEHARAEIERCLARDPVHDPRALRVLHGADALARIADALDTAWHALLATEWPRFRTVCERDVSHRTSELGRNGWAGALELLHPTVRWRTGRIEIDRHPGRRTVRLDGRGLLLVPSVFIWPGIAVHVDDPWPRAIVYPARGTAAIWGDHVGGDDDALAALVGRSRARILAALEAPASTTQLAQLLCLAVGSVGDNLAVLRNAGMVQRRRAGRIVVYGRTPLGDAVVAAASERPSD